MTGRAETEVFIPRSQYRRGFALRAAGKLQRVRTLEGFIRARGSTRKSTGGVYPAATIKRSFAR